MNSRPAWICSAFQTGCARCKAFRPIGNRSANPSTPRSATRRSSCRCYAKFRRCFMPKRSRNRSWYCKARTIRVIKPESDEIVAAIKKRGGVVEYVLFDNEGHGFTKKANEIRAYKAILDFLDKHLKGAEA